MAQDTIWLDKMTSPNIAKAISDGFDTVIMAVGSTEQHGPHLPIGTDSLLGDIMVEKIALRIGKTLAAPTIRVGVSEHHMTFSGTMTLREETLEEVLVDCCRSLARHGFKAIILIPTHGGNVATVNRTTQRLQQESLSARIISDSSGTAFVLAMAEVSPNYDITPGEAGGHAGHLETSMMLVDFPELIEMDKAARGKVDLGYGVDEELHKHGMKNLSPIGILGDATKADAKVGIAYYDCIINAIVEKIGASMSEQDG